MYSRFVNWLAATPFVSWLVKNCFSKVDPLIFRLTGGRFTATGKPTLPMIAVTVKGRKTGQPRTVQLAYYADGADYLVVASAMGQDKHPAWRYNLEANPDIEVLGVGGSFKARASVLSDEEKAQFWPAIREAIPPMKVYEVRTDRNIRVFRISRV
jgi:deazaflavin-dependent oxidoreductase (nitroreductase family)